MREILFRGKGDDGRWHYSMTIARGAETNGVIVYYYFGACPTCAIPAKTVGQFTGMHDKNGARIFEGDILSARFDDLFPENETRIAVVWCNNGWYIQQGSMFDLIEPEDCAVCEIIGNIYDNPELLDGGGDNEAD